MRPLSILLGWAVAAAALAWIASHVPFASWWKELRSAAPLAIAVGLGAVLIALALRGMRWAMLVRRLVPDAPWWNGTRAFLVGTALNNVLPLRAGDAARVLVLPSGGAVEARRTALLAALLWERAWDVTMLLAFAATAAWAARLPRISLIAAVLAGMGILGLLLMAVLPDRLARMTGRWSRLGPHVASLASSVSALGRGRAVLACGALSLVSWLAECGAYAAGCAAVGLMWRSPAPALMASAGTLGTLLPGTPGHVGTLDAAALLAAHAVAVPPDRALAAIVVTHALLWLPITLVGLLLLPFSGRGRLRIATSPS